MAKPTTSPVVQLRRAIRGLLQDKGVVRVPRGRIHEADGRRREHRSELLPKYARRKEHFAAWTSRGLSDELYSIIYARGGGGLRRLLLVLPAAGRWVADTTGIHLGIRRATLMRRARPLMC